MKNFLYPLFFVELNTIIPSEAINGESQFECYFFLLEQAILARSRCRKKDIYEEIFT